MAEHKELYEYRAQLLQRIQSAAQEFCDLFTEVPDPFSPLSSDGWNAHQVAAHVRDVDKHVYGLRLRRAVAEEHPVFENFDGDDWIAAHYNPAEPLDKILNEFRESVAELVGWLSDLPPEAWSRPTRHEVYGEFAMQTWAERGLAHILEHIRAVREGKQTR